MKVQKFYRADVVAGGATGVVGFKSPGARSERINALGETLKDGPYEHIEVSAMEYISVGVGIISGKATVALEGTNGDPNDVATNWDTLDTVTVDAAGVDAGRVEYSGATRFARVSWSAGTTPTMDVAFFSR